MECILHHRNNFSARFFFSFYKIFRCCAAVCCNGGLPSAKNGEIASTQRIVNDGYRFKLK